MAMGNSGSTDLFRSVFDVLPSMIFVVDDDVRIQEFNEAAAAFLSVQRSVVIKRRGGEVLHCLHADDVPDGCGRAPFCEDCIVRNSVVKASLGDRVVRRRAKLEILRDGNKKEIYALVTASAFRFDGRPLVLLVIEDISEIAELRRMIPICCICKKVRDDKESWSRIENYFKDHWDVDFSHSLCPECYQKEVEKIRREIQIKKGSSAEN